MNTISDSTSNFVAPAVLNGVELETIATSASLNTFKASIFASGPNETYPFMYKYELLAHGEQSDNDASWSYVVQETNESVIMFDVTTTRSFSLVATVINAYGSSVSCVSPTTDASIFNGSGTSTLSTITESSPSTAIWCPIMMSTNHLFAADDVVEDVLSLLTNQSSSTAITSLILSGLDVVPDINESTTNVTNLVSDLFDVFFTGLTKSNASIDETPDVSQLVVIMNEFVDLQSDLSDNSLDIIEGLVLVGNELESSDNVDSNIVTLYIETVDSHVSHSTAAVSLSDVDLLDEALVTACSASSSESIPGDDVEQYVEESFELSCATADAEAPLIVETETVTVVTASGSKDDSAVLVTVTTWDSGNITTGNGDSNLLSSVQGVTITTDDGEPLEETDELDAGIVLSITLSSTTSNTTSEAIDSPVSLRKAMTCKYFESASDSWSERGIVLHGMGFATVEVSAICVSSHLTLFTIEDESVAKKSF
jgi:hypothetical protein